MSFKRLLPRTPAMMFAILLAVAVCGCGGSVEEELPRAAVSGTVTLDGKPLEEGMIRFIPSEETEGPKTAAVISEGQFALEKQQGPVVGKHRIAIESTDDGGYAPDDEQALEKLKESGTRRIDAVRIPAVYNSRSTLTEIVSAEEPNEFTFDLKSNKRR